MLAVHIIFILCFTPFTNIVCSGFITQLVEHCSTNTEAMGSNAVQALFYCGGGGGGGGGEGGANLELPIINCEYHSDDLIILTLFAL